MCRIMIDLLRMHRANYANIIRNRRDMREQIGDLLARLAMLLEFGEWAARFQHGILQLRQLLSFGERFRKWFAIKFLQLRLVIEAFQMRRTARHAEMNN